MQTVTINFTASGQTLTGASLPISIASNTVEYVKAKFALGSDWTGFDSVRAIWYNDYAQIATVLDGNGECTVPWEVLAKTDDVRVNLVGSDVENDVLVDRLTSYPVMALEVDATARIDGTETAPVTPSQFEQYIAIVEQLVGSVKDIDHTTLNADYTLTIYYTDGTSDTVGPIRGAQGETGNGILSAVLNPDYTLTLNYTNGQHDTVGPIRGAKGETGNGIQSIYLTGTSGAVKTYTILFTDGNTTEFQVTDGEVTNAVLESLMPTDTASGAIASFPDGQNVFPLKSLVADINPIQDLHGYDSPWVGGAGANKWDEQWEIGGIGADGSTAGNTQTDRFRSKNFIPCSAETSYYFIMPSVSWRAFFYDSNEDFISLVGTYNGSRQITTPLNASYIKFWVLQTTYGNGIAINYPSTVTTYSPWENICPISGWNSVGVVNCGVNLLGGITLANAIKTSLNSAVIDTTNKTVSFQSNAMIGAEDNLFPTKYKENTRYTLILNGYNSVGYSNMRVYYTDGSYANMSTQTFPTSKGVFVYTTASSKTVEKVRRLNQLGTTVLYYDECGIFEGVLTADDFVAYNGTTYTTSLGTTVYGGSVDVVSGIGDAWGRINLKDISYTYTGGAFRFVLNSIGAKPPKDAYTLPNADCEGYKFVTSSTALSDGVIKFHPTNGYGYIQNSNYTDATTFANAMDGIYLVFEKTTPDVISATPTQVQTLLGTNNIFADSGDVTVEYVADIQRYIDKKLAEL